MNINMTENGNVTRVEDLLEKGIQIVGCKFFAPTGNYMSRYEKYNDQVYYYQVVEGLEVSTGDYVVVSCKTGLQVCRAVLTDPERVAQNCRGINITSYVIATTNFEHWEAYLNKRDRLDKLHKKMEKRKKELEGLAGYRLLADGDPDMAKMLKEFLDNGGMF